MTSELPSNDNAALQAHRKQANLKLLQRTCRPTITDILVSATHVVLYEYRSSWHKTTQEGTLFVVKEEDSNTASLILLNRHSTENFEVHPLTPQFQVQQDAPYLMFKHEDRVWGIYFPLPEEQQAVFQGLQRVVQQLRMNPTTMNTTVTTQTTTTVATTTVSTPAAAPPVSTTPTLPGVALDKKALQLALLSLMQDDRFLTLLHQQYLKVIRTKAASSSSPSASEK
ncbi:mRNA-decapping enzyme 1B [Fistulifera solaris]|uniref:mRNA-decapping enzyme 1B n=1 Tax=Fistulifera solaris TaxID=1519565 RepID=A0A1Z5KQ60_FISSO|nr:mRNA-decapping enzyme 1B [Fistulifera solaris]|eukprot:GAX28255.1 mRNA-decapping enzyme 1B [Fistulifera solaris]